MFKDLFIGVESSGNFWKDSIFFLEPLSTDHPPLWFLILTPTLVILSIPLSYYLFVKNTNFPNQLVNINPAYISPNERRAKGINITIGDS